MRPTCVTAGRRPATRICRRTSTYSWWATLLWPPSLRMRARGSRPTRPFLSRRSISSSRRCRGSSTGSTEEGHTMTRRDYLATNAAFVLGAHCCGTVSRPCRGQETVAQQVKENKQALIAITLDLEMSRNFPTWEETHWDYEKGNLNEPTKKYTAEACRRVKAHGGRVHCFAVGRVFEQA